MQKSGTPDFTLIAKYRDKLLVPTIRPCKEVDEYSASVSVVDLLQQVLESPHLQKDINFVKWNGKVAYMLTWDTFEATPSTNILLGQLTLLVCPSICTRPDAQLPIFAAECPEDHENFAHIMNICEFSKICEPIVWRCPMFTDSNQKCSRCEQYPSERNPTDGLHRAEADPFSGNDLHATDAMVGGKDGFSFHCGKMVTTA